MAGFILRRLISSFLVVVLTSAFVFALFFLGPSARDVPACSVPAPRRPDRRGLAQRLPATVSLAVGGSLFYLSLGVVLGALAARWRGTTADRLLVSSSLVVSSIPYYLLAWIYLTQVLPVFPQTGYFSLTDNPAAWFGGLLLPWLVLGITHSTQYARFTRGSMAETLGEDYIRTATAKGVSSNRLVFGHGLRAAIVPIVTLFGLDFATLLAGTVFTEKIFDIDGIGHLALDAIQSPQDFAVIHATVLVAAILVVIGNLVVDIGYSFLDPRVWVS